jgi:NOL1/NOP2/fmu family ribosome biogenesis protein
MRAHFLPSGEKKQVLADLENQFGIQKIPGMLIESGREKIRLFTGSLTREELVELDKAVRIELIGLYAIKKEDTYRLSIDGSYLFDEQVTKNIVNLTEDEMKQWMRGNDLPKEAPKGVVVIRFGKFFLGCGKSNGTLIYNYVPKNRRIMR